MKNRNLSRRKFINNSILTGVAATAFPFETLAQTGFETKFNKLMSNKMSEATKKLLSLLNIKHPIIQAPTGGTVNSTMTAAVSNNGAFGALPLSWSEPDYTQKQIEAVKAKTNYSFFANFVLTFSPKALDIAIKNNVPVIQFSWGMPSKEMVSKIKKAKITLGIQVTSEASAKNAIELGADYLVCQGTEAGGHVHASRPLGEALKRVLKVARDIPVVASGEA